MECVVMVPGIMGSVLETPDGEKVWPPSPGEVVFGFDKLDELLRPDLSSTDIIRRVSCLSVYSPLISQLSSIGFTEGGATQRLEIFHYDWRQDLEVCARMLSERLTDLHQAGATSIAIVAHSMGGLVSRLTLEPPTYRAAPWFGAVKALFTIGTPHLGAPQSLVRILGMEGDLGVSGEDFRTYASDPRYPSAVQLLPAPNEAAVWDMSEKAIGPINIYDPGAATSLGLDPALVARAAWVHESFASGEAPPHVRYFYFAGGGHTTCTRLNVAATAMAATMTADGGDGTVPLWSAFGGATQKQLVTGEHTKFFRRDEFAAVFYRLFGKNFTAPPTRMTGSVSLSVQGIALKPNEAIELLILTSDPVGEIDGAVTLSFTEDETTRFEPVGDPIPIRYAGPPLTQLRVALPPADRPGHYRINFAGTPAADEPALFAVQQGV